MLTAGAAFASSMSAMSLGGVLYETSSCAKAAKPVIMNDKEIKNGKNLIFMLKLFKLLS
jgi:hypothetical protein